MLKLGKDFYNQDSDIVAEQLLGKYLIRKINGIKLIGIIVETEAYIPFTDPAAHSFIGKTARNQILFGPAGYSYVYSIHKYFCLNVVCNKPNIPGCVLIRALEPVQGIEVMQNNRRVANMNITNGPGRLCQALQIDRKLNGLDITNKYSELIITNGISINSQDIITTTRIGISKAKELPLRFYVKGNNYVSKIATT